MGDKHIGKAVSAVPRGAGGRLGLTPLLPPGDDRCGRQPRGGAPGRVLPPALVPGSRQPLLLLQGGQGPCTSAPLTPRGHPSPRGSPPRSQRLFRGGGGGRPVTHRRHRHPAPALAPHRSSSAGRSWSSRWSCATPRGPVREHAGPPGAAPVPRGSAVTPLPPACLPRGEAGNWIKGHSSDGSCVVIGNREGGGRGRQWAPREHSPGPSLRFFLLVFPRPKKHFGRRHF